MRQIEHENQMILTYQKTDEGVVILRCETADPVISFPNTIDDAPVIALGSYVCAERAPDLSGAQQIQLGGGQSVSHQARTIEQVIVPSTVRSIGNYAFYNCTALKHLSLSDCVRELGHGVIMNCTAFCQLELSASLDGRTCLPDLLGQTTGEITVQLQTPNGCAQLIFPPYHEELEDLAPAHIFQRRIEGAGYTYRQCFHNGVLSLAEYDNALERLLRIQDYDTVCRVALARLRQPIGLTQTARTAYLDCLRTHNVQAVQVVLASRDPAQAAALLALHVLDESGLHRACDGARNTGQTEMLSLFLAALGHTSRPQAKSYDL